MKKCQNVDKVYGSNHTSSTDVADFDYVG